MNSKYGRTARIAVAAACFFSAIVFAQAQVTPPLPSQLATAKSVFLTNASSGKVTEPSLAATYYTLYNRLLSSKRFQMVTAPADADLSFEFSVNGTGYLRGENSWGWSYFLQVRIRDAKTQALLWTVSENVEGAIRSKTWDRNVSDAIGRLADDLIQISTPGSTAASAAPPSKPQKKTRLQDRGGE